MCYISSVLQVFFAYALVTANEAILFVDEHRLDESARNVLGSAVALKNYESFIPELKKRVDILGAVAGRSCRLYIGSDFLDYMHIACIRSTMEKNRNSRQILWGSHLSFVLCQTACGWAQAVTRLWLPLWANLRYLNEKGKEIIFRYRSYEYH